LAVRRGDLVTIALQGDLGKPRPALIIQSNLFEAHPSITILPVTGELRDAPLFRITVQPTENNGLSKPSQIMVDKPQSVAREKIGEIFGRLEDESMVSVNRALAIFIGVA
jgi:mRNA interferase MazF